MFTGISNYSMAYLINEFYKILKTNAKKRLEKQIEKSKNCWGEAVTEYAIEQAKKAIEKEKSLLKK